MNSAIRLTSPLVLTLLAFIAPVSGGADTCTWDGADGQWTDGAHWSCGHAPGSGDTAVIDRGTVRITSDQTVRSLSLSGGTLRQRGHPDR